MSMTKRVSILERIAEALAKVGENVNGAHYMVSRNK